MFRVLNYQFDRPDPRDRKLKSTFKASTNVDLLPAKTDLTPQLGQVLDQGSLGACTLHSVSTQLTFLSKKKGDELYWSRLLMYWNGRALARYPLNQDTGLPMRTAIRGAANGIALEDDWPYVINKFAQRPPLDVVQNAEKCITYFAVEQNLGELRRALVKGPISFGMTLRTSFLAREVEETGMVPIPAASEELEGGHAMTLVGYDSETKHFRVRNSWGRDWGVNGDCFVPESMILAKTTGDFWQVRDLSWNPARVKPAIVPSPAPASPSLKEDSSGTRVADKPAPSEWVPNHMYANGELVTYKGDTYKCLVRHMSSEMWRPSETDLVWG